MTHNSPIFPQNIFKHPSAILADAIQADYNHELEWLWIADEVSCLDERRYCLQRALYVNPSSIIARDRLAKLNKVQMPVVRRQYRQWNLYARLFDSSVG